MRFRVLLLSLTAGLLCPLWCQSGAAPAISAPGFELLWAELYTGNLNYAVPIGPAIRSASLGDGIVAGSSSALGWHSSPGEDGLSVLYRVSYERNSLNASISGLSQNLRLQWRGVVKPRLTMQVTASGSSESFLSFMQNSQSVSLMSSDSSGNLTMNGSSPFQLSLAGQKRREYQGGVNAQYLLSPRSLWTFQARASKELATNAVDPASGVTGYPGATTASASAAFTRKLSRRTSVSTEAGYAKTFSALVPNSLGTLDVKVQKELTPQWLCFAAGGYGLLLTRYDGISRTTLAPRAQLGVEWKSRTVFAQATALQTAGDAYGLGASDRSALQLALGRSAPGSKWRYQLSGGYERLSGQVFPLIRDWVVTASVIRKLSDRTEVRAEGIWTTEIGSILTAYPHLNRQGVRLSFFWIPNPRI